MAQIRQEINLLNAEHFRGGGSSGPSNTYKFLSETGSYNGDLSFYAEFVAKRVSSNISDLSRFGIYDTNNSKVLVGATGIPTSLVYDLYRIPIPQLTGATYDLYTAGGSSGIFVKSAKIILYQNSDTITNTLTKIDIGALQQSIGATTTTPLTNPKYFYYDSSKWNGQIVAYGEATYLTSTTKGLATIKLQNDDGNFGSWTDTAIIVAGGNAIVPTRVRSSGISLISGRNYRVTVQTDSTKGLIDIYGAKIILNSSRNGDWFNIIGGNANRVVQGGTASSNEAKGQSFVFNENKLISGVKVAIKKNGNPAGSFAVYLYTGSPPESFSTIPITSGNYAASQITTGAYTILFSGNYNLLAGITGTLAFVKNPNTNSAGNDYGISGTSTNDVYPYGLPWNRNSSVWTSDIGNVGSFYFDLLGADYPTKFECQYLLANNTGVATGVQSYYTIFDPNEWQGVTNTYIHEATSTGNLVLDMDLVSTGVSPILITGSTLTDLTQREQSSALTMPLVSGTIDVRITSNP